jgi:hypothetical protein
MSMPPPVPTKAERQPAIEAVMGAKGSTKPFGAH